MGQDRRTYERAWRAKNRDRVNAQARARWAAQQAGEPIQPLRTRHEPYLIDLVWAEGPPFDFEPLSPTEKGEICRRWIRSGRSLQELRRLTGWKPERYYRINDTP